MLRPPPPPRIPRPLVPPLLAVLLLLLAAAIATAAAAHDAAAAAAGVQDTWAVLACTSRFWFNYRHVANALAVYRVLRRLGVPDARIVLMLADDMPCNARNARPGTVFKSTGHEADLCAGGIEVDYKGNEVTVENFLRVLTGRHAPGTPLSRRLGSGPGSRVLVYMTGHGGDEFLKFHNHEEVGGADLAGALAEMKAGGRFGELFFVVDTCQGGTLFRPFRTEGVLAVGSSAKGENSYAHQNDLELGVALVDRFTDATSDYVHLLADRVAPLRPAAGARAGAGAMGSGGGGGHHHEQQQMQPPQQLPRVRNYLDQVPLARLLESYQPAQLRSHPVVRTELYKGWRAGHPSIAAFFSDAARVRVLPLPVTTGGDAAEPPLRRRRRPGEGIPENEAAAARTAWAKAVFPETGADWDGEQEEQEAPKSAPWLWVALGLVGVGLTKRRGADEENDEDEVEAKGGRRKED